MRDTYITRQAELQWILQVFLRRPVDLMIQTARQPKAELRATWFAGTRATNSRTYRRLSLLVMTGAVELER